MKLSDYYKGNASYSKELANLTGSALNAIILEAAIKECIANNGPFILFPNPCTNEMYTKGRSWEESYGISPQDLKETLKQIATHVTKTHKREDVLQNTLPEFNSNGELLNKNSLLMYWKNYKGHIYFDINATLIKNLFEIDRDGTWKNYIYVHYDIENSEPVVLTDETISSFNNFNLETDGEVNAE